TSRAAAFADYDDDGDIDIVVIEREASVTLLENVIATPGRSVTLTVTDERGHEAVGALVGLRAGGRQQWRLVQRAYSFQASNDPRVHFGLPAGASVEEVVVRWLDGTVESFGPRAPGRGYTLNRGEGRVTPE
ncbi:MAG: hypothetical protein GY716_06975, partial [bacterium]|nr:hypothetical protein [bacterium]